MQKSSKTYYTQKRQTIAHEKQLLINQLIDDTPTSYTQ